MTALLDRVRALVALTSSASEDEARSAAVQACRLIRENALEISFPRPAAVPPPPDSETVSSGSAPPPATPAAAWAAKRGKRETKRGEDVVQIAGEAAGEVASAFVQTAFKNFVRRVGRR